MEYLFPLVARQEIAQETMEFTFDLEGTDYTYKPGQHTDYAVINPPYTDAEGDIRTFSFVSAPGSGRIQIATRMRDTAFKNWLKEMPLGTKVKVKEPMGRMTLHEDATKPAVWLVGGIGITPFMGMVHALKKSGEKREIYLFYSNASPKTAAFLPDLEDYARANPNFHFIPAYTDAPPPSWTGETGRITAEMVKKYVKDLPNCIFYTAGPPAMVSAIIKLVEDAGVPESQIKSEDFDGY